MAQSQSKKLSSTRNPIARLLKHFTPQRFKDKTKYSRKRKFINKEEEHIQQVIKDYWNEVGGL